MVHVQGQPLVFRTLRSLFDGGVQTVVFVTAIDNAPLVRAASVLGFSDSRLRIVVNPDPSRGMLSSLQAGMASVPDDVDRVLILPADMPFVRPATVAAIAGHADARAVILPTHAGRHGHPIGVPATAAVRDAVHDAEEGSTLKDVLARADLVHVELDVDDPGVLRDVDEPGDLERG
jgi:molybdenum cofactor cytidylyltransferase